MFKKGHISWAKNKKFSQSHIENLRKSHLGYVMPEEQKRKISLANKGKKKPPFSEEHRRKISLSLIGSCRHKGHKHSEETKKKISKIHKGKIGYWRGKKRPPISEKTRQKMKETAIRVRSVDRLLALKIKKENHWNWKGGISTETEKIRHSIESKLWQDSVKNRDCNYCQKCGENRVSKLTAHHIQNFAQYPELRFAIDNGITLCRDCHREFHKRCGYKNNTKEQIKEFIIKLKLKN